MTRFHVGVNFEVLVIYSCEAGPWKYQTHVRGSFEIPKNAKRAFFNGILHLMAPFENLIVVVDVEGDNWLYVYIPWPPDYDGWACGCAV